MTCSQDRTSERGGRDGAASRASRSSGGGPQHAGPLQSGPRQSGPRWPTALALALAIAALAAFCLWPIAANPGFWNHDELVLADALQHGAPCWDWSWFARGSELFYRPLGYAVFSFQLDLAASAPAVHWLSLVHHAINIALCALLFRRLGLPAMAAAVIVLLPSAVEGVAWVAAAYDRTALLLLLLAALALSSRGAIALLAVPCYALALATKETSVAFPVVAVVIVWARRVRAHDAVAPDPGLLALLRSWPARAAAIVGVMALGFLVFRLRSGASAPPYAMRIDSEVPIRLLRYLAFPFAFPADQPQQVWAQRWLPALSCSIVLFAVAVRRNPRLALSGTAVAIAMLVPVLPLQRSQGNYAYLAGPGLALVTWAAIATARGGGARPVRWRLGSALWAATVLLALAWHTHTVAASYRRTGQALHDLAALHDQLPAEPSPVAIACAPGLAEAAALRFAFYLDRTGRRPALAVIAADAAGAADAPLQFAADGSLHRR